MLAQILHFIIYVTMTFFIIVVALRFLLQQVRADFYNPLSQAIVKITRPFLMPLRRVIPSVLGLDTASLVLMILVQLIVIFVLGLVLGSSALFAFPLRCLGWAVLGSLTIISNIFFWAIIISIVSSWIAPHSNHPLLSLVQQLIEPIMRPVRKLLPPLGGVIDVSPILVLMGLKIIDMLLLAGASRLLLDPRLVLGIW